MAAPLKRCVVQALKYNGSYGRQKVNLPLTLRENRINIPVNYYVSTVENPGEIFRREDVQALLKKATGLDIDKVFRIKPTDEFKAPKYKLLTTAELKKVEEETYQKAQERLQMPPYLKAREDVEQVISDNPEIDGYDTRPIAFIDISNRIPRKDRLIVVREPEGKLRMPTHRERNNILQVFYPLEGRVLHLPEMFEEESLERLLEEGQHEYILDRAVVQFEPNDHEFIRITHRTYEHLNSINEYDKLRSTRFFGPMSFYLAHYNKMDGLLADMIQRNMIENAADMIHIYHKLHPDAKSIEYVKNLQNPLDIVQAYLDHDSPQAEVVELAVQTYKDSLSDNNRRGNIHH